MFQMLLVLALVAVVCAGVPSLLIAYAGGKIALPRWVLNLLVCCLILLAAMSVFPLSMPRDVPAGPLGALVIYGFVGYVLRRAYTKANWLPCMACVPVVSCVGIGVKWLVCHLGMVREVPAFSPGEIIVFLLLAQAVALVLFFTTADPLPKKEHPYQKPVRRRRF